MVSFRPHVIFSAAITLDGKLATRTGDSKLSSKKDKIRVHKLRSKVDAILIGKNTVEIDDPLLSAHNIRKKNPIRIILDSNATIRTNSKILKKLKKFQLPLELKKRKADFVIKNNFRNNSIKKNVKRVLEKILLNA